MDPRATRNCPDMRLAAPRRQSLLRSCLAAHSFPRRPPAYVLSALRTPFTPIRLCPDTSRRVASPNVAEFGKYRPGEAPSCGGWGREGVRSEARAEQRLAPGGRAALPLTRTKYRRAALPLTRTEHSAALGRPDPLVDHVLQQLLAT